MKPESEWFRAPNHMELVSRGDVRNFMWVAEPEIHKGVYGVSYMVAATLVREMGLPVLILLKEAAKVELYRRIEAGEKRGEGELLEAFAWTPVFVRDEDGTLKVQSLDVAWRTKEGVFVSKQYIDITKLYSRPGRFISVEGEVSDGTHVPD